MRPNNIKYYSNLNQNHHVRTYSSGGTKPSHNNYPNLQLNLNNINRKDNLKKKEITSSSQIYVKNKTLQLTNQKSKDQLANIINIYT